MNNLIRIKILILISLLTFSCGKKKTSTSSKISVVSGISALTGQFPGGVVLFARNLGTGYLLVKNITAGDIEVEFDNGKYEFLIMGWSGTEMMTGTASCADKGDVNLVGKDITLDFNLQSGDCNTLSTSPGALHFHSNVMGGNVPAINGDYSVKLSLPDFNGVPSTKLEELPSGFIGSTCLEKDSANDSINLDSSSSFPAIDIPIVAQVFDGNSTCDGAPTRMYILPNGLDEDDYPYTVNSVNIPLNELVFTVEVNAADTMTLPLPIGYSYNLNVNWGDGNTSTVTAYNSPGISNTYSSTGEYVVRISGLAEAFTCNSSTACDFITHVLNFGDLGYIDLSTGFKGSGNLLSFSGGKTHNVTDMSNMFYGTSSLASVNLSSFDTTSVTKMNSMFWGASTLSTLNIDNFSTSIVTNMDSMFRNTTILSSLNLSNFDTTSVTNMSYMFGGSGLTNLDLTSFDTTATTSMIAMFNGMVNLTTLDISSFNTSNIGSLQNMFKDSSSLSSLDLSNFNTSGVNDMRGTFENMSSLTTLDILSFDTSSVDDMNSTFKGTSSLTNLDVSHFDTSSVIDMANMFNGASLLTTIDVSAFDTSLVTDMTAMFYGMNSLNSVNLGAFDTSNVTSLNAMFNGATSLTALDLSNFDTSSVNDTGFMFYDNSSLASLNTTGWSIANVASSTNMFTNANPGLMVICNDQDTTTDGSGTPGTGTFFGETCN